MRRLATNSPPVDERVADLLVDDLVGQAKLRDLAAHHSAGARIGIEDDDLVADRGEIARDRQRSRAGPDAGDALAVSLGGRLAAARKCRSCDRRRRA